MESHVKHGVVVKVVGRTGSRGQVIHVRVKFIDEHNSFIMRNGKLKFNLIVKGKLGIEVFIILVMYFCKSYQTRLNKIRIIYVRLTHVTKR
ncbi:hypothetical protein ACJIZ3_020726 [Penstemon smallii]|uniref:Uncharacterized protein n=1 Tax=Penstemon smallii TaxID=265156 RepID=A0ABD3SJM9_9LAMI